MVFKPGVTYSQAEEVFAALMPILQTYPQITEVVFSPGDTITWHAELKLTAE